jgi:tetratricopeptide (TPR) repeat protein
VREQFALALNRDGQRNEAISVLQQVIDENGPSSETSGLMGRVCKDLWKDAIDNGKNFLATGYLDQAIANYVKGFEADWRDAYPGVNAVTLLDIKGDGPSQKRKAELLPVVHYAVNQRLKSGRPDYWDYATLLELAVLENDWNATRGHLTDALAAVRESWEPISTINNLTMINEARQKRGITNPELDQIIDALKSRAA